MLATGAHERPLVYGNNDIPGCMLANAISTYIQCYAVIPGNKLVLMTTNDSAYQAAIDWHDAGRQVMAIIDTRPKTDSAIIQQAQNKGINIIFSHAVIEVQGSKRVNSVNIAPINNTGDNVIGPAINIVCDTVASSGGWSPVLHLSSHLGQKPLWRDDIIGFVPGQNDLLNCGAVSGKYALLSVIEDGIATGGKAAELSGFERLTDLPIPDIIPQITAAPMALFHVPHIQTTSRAPKQFVDYQNDVTAAAIELANREGFESIEHVKRYTALGFGTDQGKLGNINGIAITAKSLAKTIPETGTTIFRPMYTPTTMGALAGAHVKQLFAPARFTAMHQWHLQHGAEFEDVGQWKRPWYFPKNGESMQQALLRECLATRNSVGILDASTLGKIDIQGKDAREFLNRIYTNAWSKLGIGKCRYGVMCKEDGMIFDDGVTSCINDHHFIMTTTTGGAAGVLQWLELWHQTEWPELEVYFTSVTDHWTTMTISGPNSRKVLQKVCQDDVSKQALPFMSWIDATVAGVKARIFRISFTGELSFEINVPANLGLSVWQHIMDAGAEFEITPYGTETMHILRAEKGFIIVGQDTDGSVTPQDLDMNWVISPNKSFSCIGKRSWDRIDTKRNDRKQMVGLKAKDTNQVLPEGAQIVLDPQQKLPMTMVGHVTSSYFSACLGYSFALALVKSGTSRYGETVYLPQANGQIYEAEICSPIFYDPKGERQHVE